MDRKEGGDAERRCPQHSAALKATSLALAALRQRVDKLSTEIIKLLEQGCSLK